MWASLPFLYLFVQGYTYIFLLSVLPMLRRGGPRSAPPRALPLSSRTRETSSPVP
jgi:hypothetical protein